MEERGSWSPTLSGLLDELKAAIMVLLDANSAYCLGLTSKNFLKIIKDPQLRMHKKLFKLVEDALMLEAITKAFKIINSCLILFPWYWKLWRKRTKYWNSKHDFTKVLQDLRKAYEVCTKNSFRHIIMSDIYAAANEAQLALSEVQKAIELDPNRLGYQHQLLFVSSSTGMSLQDQAAGYLMLLRQGYKSAVIIHNNVGYAYYLLARDDEAAEHYKKALELNPSYPRVMLHQAILYLYRNECVEAQVYCAQAQMINPNIPEIHLTLAIVYYNTKQYERAVEEAQKSWELTDRMDLRTAKLYFLMLDRLGAIDKLVEELSGCIDYYAAQLSVVEDEISKINDDDALMIKAANRKKIVLTKLLHYALKCRVQSHVFLGEFDSAVKLYEESKTFAAAEEDDKFFDLLFNQKVVNFDNVVISKQLITKIARLSLHYDSERKKFIEQIDSKVTSVDEVSFFTICLLHKIKGVQLHQFRLNSLNQRDENSLRSYWTNTQMQLEGGSELQVIAKHWIPSSSS